MQQNYFLLSFHMYIHFAYHNSSFFRALTKLIDLGFSSMQPNSFSCNEVQFYLSFLHELNVTRYRRFNNYGEISRKRFFIYFTYWSAALGLLMNAPSIASMSVLGFCYKKGVLIKNIFPHKIKR